MQFEQLSFDIYSNILDFLEPFDILSLRRTCRTLHHTTSQRIVWINALRRACHRNLIFMPTFPVHGMSLSALEYAATAPWRFLRRESSPSGFLTARSHHIITLNEDEEFREIFLVPGGRYLVTRTDTTLAVWDLGIPGYPPAKAPMQISTAAIPLVLNHILVHASEDGRGFNILLRSVTENRTRRFSIFRIYPEDENPVLLKIAELDMPWQPPPSGSITIKRHAFLGSKVIYLQGPILNVWDFEEDAWARLEVPGNHVAFMVSKTAILLFYDHEVLIWKMPPLSTNKPMFFSSPPSCIPPVRSLESQIDWNAASECRGSCNWYSGTIRRLLLDVSYSYKFKRFEVVHTNEDWNTSAIVDLGTFPDGRDRRYECRRVCNDTLVSWCTVFGIIDAHLTEVPSASLRPKPKPIRSTFALYLRGPIEDGIGIPASLCPFSGRFANINDKRKLRIIDYLSESLPVVTRTSSAAGLQ